MKLKPILQKAYSENFAIGGFNFFNLDSARAIAKAAARAKKPALMMVTEGSIEYAGLDYLVATFEKVKAETGAEVSLHLDHGKNIELLKDCVKKGFDSVMFDGSSLPLDQNILISTDLRKYAHNKGAIFEAEIGHVGGHEDNVSSAIFKTNPAEALMFYDSVKPDMLAVAIGNVHGVLTTDEQLDFTLLAKIQDTIKAPIVLHGCSNRSARDYQVAISEGVIKINIDTEIRQIFVESMHQALKQKMTDPRKILSFAEDQISKHVEERIELFAKGCCIR